MTEACFKSRLFSCILTTVEATLAFIIPNHFFPDNSTSICLSRRIQQSVAVYCSVASFLHLLSCNKQIGSDFIHSMTVIATATKTELATTLLADPPVPKDILSTTRAVHVQQRAYNKKSMSLWYFIT